MSDHPKTAPENGAQLQETKLEVGSMSGPLVTANHYYNHHGGGGGGGWKVEMIMVVLRLVCFMSSVIALASMVSAEQKATVYIYVLQLPVHAKWSFSYSFQYLVGVSVAVAVHSLLQLLIGVSRVLRKSPVILSRRNAWLIFAGDQVFAYAMMSGGAAASGVTNLNRTGIQYTALPNFCKSLHSFCDHVGVSIAFTFFSCLLLATSAVLEVIWLSKN